MFRSLRRCRGAGQPLDSEAERNFAGCSTLALGQYVRFYLDEYKSRPDAIFSRELAFAALGAAAMHRATGCPLYRRQLERLIDVLLEFEMRFESRAGIAASGFLMRKDNPNPAYLDCQSAALLALTQAARIIEDRGCLKSSSAGSRPTGWRRRRSTSEPAAGSTRSGMASPDAAGEIGETAFWNFKAGLSLRFFGALRRSPNAAVQAIASRHRDRVAVFETVLRRQLAQAAAEHGGASIPHLGCVGEANSETQPWVMLGLLGHPFD